MRHTARIVGFGVIECGSFGEMLRIANKACEIVETGRYKSEADLSDLAEARVEPEPAGLLTDSGMPLGDGNDKDCID